MGPRSAEDSQGEDASPYPQSVEREIVRDLGAVYGPYTRRCFASTTETDIEHIVAESEAHDSGMCAADAATKARFARDLRNLTLAAPEVNRFEKSGKDAGEWLPARNRCWFAARVVEVRKAYGLTIDRSEADALESILSSCDTTALEAVVCAVPSGAPFTHLRPRTMPWRSTTTMGTAALCARRRGCMGLRRCRGRTRRTNSCGTPTRPALLLCLRLVSTLISGVCLHSGVPTTSSTVILSALLFTVVSSSLTLSVVPLKDPSIRAMRSPLAETRVAFSLVALLDLSSVVFDLSSIAASSPRSTSISFCLFPFVSVSSNRSLSTSLATSHLDTVTTPVPTTPSMTIAGPIASASSFNRVRNLLRVFWTGVVGSSVIFVVTSTIRRNRAIPFGVPPPMAPLTFPEFGGRLRRVQLLGSCVVFPIPLPRLETFRSLRGRTRIR